jgi:hypothetical protein
MARDATYTQAPHYGHESDRHSGVDGLVAIVTIAYRLRRKLAWARLIGLGR